MTKTFGIVTALALGSTAIAGYTWMGHESPASQPGTVIASKVAAASPHTGLAHAAVTARAESLVRAWAGAALHGKALGIPEADQGSYSALIHRWGPGAHGTGIDGITYLTYGSHHAVVGINEGAQLVDVRSYSPNLHQITLADIKAVLGNPDSVRHTPGSRIYAYKRGPYQLLWVFTGSSANATVNHADVQWPKGMVAPMASQSAVVRFTASGSHVHPSTSTMTVTTGETLHFAPGNAATAKRVQNGGYDLYGAEFLGHSVPKGLVPLNLADWIHGWSYKFTRPGTWRFAIVPHTKATGNAPVTITVTVHG